MTKEAIHGEYLAQLQEHAQKEIRREGHRAVVIGADWAHENIGAAIARDLREADFGVVAPSIEVLDVTDYRACDDYFQQHDDADVLVLSHGQTEMAWFEDMSQEHIDQILRVNLTGSVYAIQAFVNATMDSPYRKRIVSIGSMAYRSVLNASAVYCASKAGLAHLVRCLGWELTPKAFDIFGVHPSNTEGTPMTEHTIEGIAAYRGLDEAAARAYWASIKLLPGWLQTQDIAAVVRFLVTEPAASFLSGTQIELSGGQR
jgi:NAD(P)-dependent dehydrogenase (short-subunit alcohol dehydrogenase family)